VQEAGDACFKKYPSLKQAGEAGENQVKNRQVLRRHRYYLRLIKLLPLSLAAPVAIR